MHYCNILVIFRQSKHVATVNSSISKFVYLDLRMGWVKYTRITNCKKVTSLALKMLETPKNSSKI